MSFDIVLEAPPTPRKLRLKAELPRYGLAKGAIAEVASENPLSKTVTVTFKRGMLVLTLRADRLEEIPLEYSTEPATT